MDNFFSLDACSRPMWLLFVRIMTSGQKLLPPAINSINSIVTVRYSPLLTENEQRYF